MSRFFAAIRFLTVLPLPPGWGEGEAALAGSAPFFPLVGALVGAAAAAFAWALGARVPDLLASVLVVAALMAASGGLHMDGLSDTADGLFGTRSRERRLEIMRDSRVGAMGVMAIVVVFAVKAAALSAVPAEARWRCAFLMPVAGRCALVVAMAAPPYARAGDGLGAVFFRRRPKFGALLALPALGGAGWIAGEMCGLVAAGASLGATLLVSLYVYRRVGGSTGDTLGATCEVVECMPAVAFAAWPV